jgi:hypothetical protein
MGLTFGPYDTIYGVCGLIIVVSGLLIIGRLRPAESAEAVPAMGEPV